MSVRAVFSLFMHISPWRVRSCLNGPTKRFRRSFSLSMRTFPCDNMLDCDSVALYLRNMRLFSSRLFCFLVTRQLHEEEHT